MDTLKRLKGSQVEIRAEVSAKALGEIAQAVLREVSEEVELAGFRKGKAPRLMVIEAVGIATIRDRVVRRAMNGTIHQVIDRHKLVPISQPAIAIKSFDMAHDGTIAKQLDFTARFDVMPMVKIAEYRTEKLTAKERAATKPASVDDSDVSKLIEHLRLQKADLLEVKRPVAAGDWVEVSFAGSVKGVAQERLQSAHFPLVVGSHTAEPAFEQALIGIAKGQEKKFAIAIKGYDQPVDFTVTLIDHKGMKLPEVNDAFALLFGHQTVSELRQSIADALAKQRQQLAQHALEDIVVKKLINKTKTELPQSLLEREIDRLIGRLRDEVMAKGLQFEEYLLQQKQSIEGLRRKFGAQAHSAVVTGLALAEVAKREHIDTTSPDATRQVLEKLIRYALQ